MIKSVFEYIYKQSVFIATILLLLIFTRHIFLNFTSKDKYSWTIPQKSYYIKNIENKCGVKDNDLLWTTVMKKISNCIDDIKFVRIVIGKSTYYVPKDSITYTIMIPER